MNAVPFDETSFCKMILDEGLEKSIEWCSRTETEIKTGRIDGQIGLELLIVGLAEGKQ